MAGTTVNLDLVIACFGPQPSTLFDVSFYVGLHHKWGRFLSGYVL